MATTNDERVASLLRAALSMDDVSDFYDALKSLPQEELGGYLSSVLSDDTAAAEIAALTRLIQGLMYGGGGWLILHLTRADLRELGPYVIHVLAAALLWLTATHFPRR